MARGPYEYSKADYLQILQDSRKWRTKTPLEIGVIGAGMSGLVAGWLLQRAGHKVDIYEASKVVGGRVRTLREGFSSGLYAEAGAMRIPEGHKLTLYLARTLFGLQTERFIDHCPNTVIAVNDERVFRHTYDKRPSLLGYDLVRGERGKTASAMFDLALMNYIRRIEGLENFEIKDFLDDETQTARDRNRYLLSELDKHSLRTFFHEDAFLDKGRRKGRRISPGAIEMICTVMGLEMQMPMSLAEVIDEHSELHRDDELVSIVGGMDMLPKSFVGLGNGPKSKQMDLHINYSARVTRILSVPGEKGLEIGFEQTQTHEPDIRQYHRLVIATPFSSLRHVRMPALLSQEKSRAIRQIHYENSCKTCLEFSDRFWTREHQGARIPGARMITGGRSVTDLATRQLLYPSAESLFKKKGGILVSYTWGDDSLRWTSLQKADRIRRVYDEVNIIQNRDQRNGKNILNACFVGGVSHSWAEDEFTSGAFVTFEPYQMTELFESIWKADMHIHYCGEHTSLKHGWIEGAVESAIRAAAEIVYEDAVS